MDECTVLQVNKNKRGYNIFLLLLLLNRSSMRLIQIRNKKNVFVEPRRDE